MFLRVHQVYWTNACLTAAQPSPGDGLRENMGGEKTALRESVSVDSVAPSKTKSFIRNSPTSPESAGKPPRLGSQPGGCDDE